MPAPYVRFSGPAHVLRLSLLLSRGEKPWTFELSPRATRRSSASHRPMKHNGTPSSRGLIAGIGRLVLSWEQHSEFVAYTFFLYDLEIPFQTVRLRCPGPGADGLDGEASVAASLVATRLAIGSPPEMPDGPGGTHGALRGPHRQWQPGHGRPGGRLDLLPRARGRLRQNRRSSRATSRRRIWAAPWSVFSRSKTPTISTLSAAADRPGREAAACRGRDVAWSRRWTRCVGPESVEEKRTVLDALLSSPPTSSTSGRGSPTALRDRSAYFSPSGRVGSRTCARRRSSMSSSLSRFVMRRVRPAAETYRGLLDRLAKLSERIARAADLLRTGIELHVEEQNGRLLESVDRQGKAASEAPAGRRGAVGRGDHLLRSRADRSRAQGDSKPEASSFDLDATLGLVLPFLLAGVWAVVRVSRRRFRDDA